MRMSLQPMLERVVSGVESKKAVFSTSTIGENEAVSLIGKFDVVVIVVSAILFFERIFDSFLFFRQVLTSLIRCHLCIH